MNAKDKIRQALEQIMSDGNANACQIFKGYDHTTGLTGWHYIPFGGNAQYIGDNVQGAIGHIEELEEIIIAGSHSLTQYGGEV